MTPPLIRAARALLSWDQQTLAQHAALSLDTIRDAEQTGRQSPRTQARIKAAFAAAGLTFRVRGPRITLWLNM